MTNQNLLSGNPTALIDAAMHTLHPSELPEILSHWHDLLLTTEKGAIRPCLANAITALRHAPEWAGVLVHNEFAERTAKLKPPPFPTGLGWWTDEDDRRTCDWLQHAGIMIGPNGAADAVAVASADHPVHPVREYLNGLVWDQTKRLDGWIFQCLGAQPDGEDAPERLAQMKYLKAVGSAWMISAVARVFQPGAKADCCLILEGRQGLKKSTALKVLGGEWFTDQLSDLSQKDACMQVHGVWIVEIAELDAMTRSEVSAVKSFMSRTTDHFRPPYGRRVGDFPRQCVFAGSVNLSTYLKDETGARRFWPVKCGEIDIPLFEADRDQLWAEAVARYKAGEPWWIEDQAIEATAQAEQAERYQSDAWDSIIAEFCAVRDDVSVKEILADGLKLDVSRWGQAESNRVSRALRSLGWLRYYSGPRSKRTWRYRPVQSRLLEFGA
jgi:predicted P-loop ATPase